MAFESVAAQLTRLKWLAILAPILFVALLEYVVWRLQLPFATWPGRVVLAGVVVIAMLFLYGAVFAVLRGMYVRLERQNRELLALHEATREMHGELSLDRILQRVVEEACDLLDARYGAISVVGKGGRMLEFHHYGIDAETVRRIGPLPRGYGLLGVVLHAGERLRIPNVSEDPRSYGFPEHHPKMRSLLAVPIVCQGPFRGNLYLTEKSGTHEFGPADEETLVRFATQAAVAIDMAYLHQQLRSLAVAEERARIAREMHDGMAQVLAYVNTKAQAVREYLRQQRLDEASSQLEQLAGAARDVYTDVREGILGLRATPGEQRPLAAVLHDFIERWQEQTGLRIEARIAPELPLSASSELQLLRIVQEALANVRKHADAGRISLQVGRGSHRVVAEIRDDGRGFDPAAPHQGELPRFGLSIMRERAESVGGELTIESQPGGGTTVRLELPALH